MYLIDQNDVVENGDGMCVFMDTFQDSETLLLQELGTCCFQAHSFELLSSESNLHILKYLKLFI